MEENKIDPMEVKAVRILNELGIDEPVLNIYPYGSRIYGTADPDSDEDFIIVTKGAMLKSGAFRQNAISNRSCSVQGVVYSRGGFIDAINNYEIGALECMFLPEDLIVKKTWPFKIQKWDTKEMARNIISKASSSWHVADLQAKDGFKDRAKKGIFHALRILNFGLQLKETQRIHDFECSNYIWEEFKLIPDEGFDTRDYIKERDELMAKLRS